MDIVITVVSSILVFGFLIFIHEFGHYLTARLFHITVEEFSVGMGPRLLSYESKKTKIIYSLAMFPIGGFVLMPGEDGEREEYANDPNTFDKKPAWKRFIVVLAGAAVNIIAGFLAMILLTALINIGDTRVGEFYDPQQSGYTVSSQDSGLMIGDEIIEVEGRSVVILDELSYEIMRHGNKPIDLKVIRNGETQILYDVVFPTSESQGQTFGVRDFKVYAVDKDFGSVMRYSWRKSVLIVRMCWESLADLITGRYTFAAVSGPVGISGAIGEAASNGFASLLYIVVLISINLGVMNLLPLPALDGGRLFMILFEMITRKKLPHKVEGIINGVGLVLLLGLSVVIMVKDIFTLVG